MKIVLAVALSCAAIAVHAQQPIRGQVRDPQGLEAPRVPRQPQRIVLVDRIVAVVGREVVTASELAERRELAERQLRQQGTPLPERVIMERQILERLIVDKAQLQLAKENGIRVEEVHLDRALERIAENNKMSLSAFRDALEKFPDVRIVASICGDYQHDRTLRAGEVLLKSAPRFAAILAANDVMALGMLEVLAAAGRASVVVGVNAIPDAITAIKRGTLLATVDFDAMKMGCLATEAAIRHLRGERLPREIVLPVQIVDRGNCAQWDKPFEERACPRWEDVVG